MFGIVPLNVLFSFLLVVVINVKNKGLICCSFLSNISFTTGMIIWMSNGFSFSAGDGLSGGENVFLDVCGHQNVPDDDNFCLD